VFNLETCQARQSRAASPTCSPSKPSSVVAYARRGYRWGAVGVCGQQENQPPRTANSSAHGNRENVVGKCQVEGNARAGAFQPVAAAVCRIVRQGTCKRRRRRHRQRAW